MTGVVFGPVLLVLGGLYAVTVVSVVWLVCSTWAEVRGLDRRARYGTAVARPDVMQVTRTVTEQWTVQGAPQAAVPVEAGLVWRADDGERPLLRAVEGRRAP